MEDHSLVGGFGSAVLELLIDKGIDTQAVHRLGVPDKFIEHGSRDVILKLLNLDAEGMYKTFISVWNRLEPAVIKNKEEYKETSNLI